MDDPIYTLAQEPLILMDVFPSRQQQRETNRDDKDRETAV
jgi:hypothetical protein